MRNVRLTLRREALAPLTAVEMQHVAGGSHAACGVTDNCTELITHGYTFDACAVPTFPVNECVNNITSAIAISSPC